MKKSLNILSGTILVGLFLAPLLFVSGVISEPAMKTALFAGTVLWFLAMIPRMRGGGGVGLLVAAAGAFF